MKKLLFAVATLFFLTPWFPAAAVTSVASLTGTQCTGTWIGTSIGGEITLAFTEVDGTDVKGEVRDLTNASPLPPRHGFEGTITGNHMALHTDWGTMSLTYENGRVNGTGAVSGNPYNIFTSCSA